MIGKWICKRQCGPCEFTLHNAPGIPTVCPIDGDTLTEWQEVAPDAT
jgi:hypothetical protein